MVSKDGPFIFWDGEETKDAGYCLFGCSVGGARPDSGTYIQAPRLQTRQMLDLLLDVSSDNAQASHVAFSFDYDVNQILGNLSWPALSSLRANGKVNWDGYTIEHIPHKIFKVSRDKKSIRIDDIFSYFRCRYDKALRKYSIGDTDDLEKISLGKDARSDFWWQDIDSIRHYWGLEVSLGCDLMEKIRRMAHRAGYFVTQWYGPGALAAFSLKQHKVSAIMKQSPVRVHAASLSAYAGGWFERFKMGVYDGPVYTYDINSAYVYAMSLLPDLSTGSWEHVLRPSKELVRGCRYGVFRCDWTPDYNAYLRACHGVPFPLFHRDPDGTMHRPVKRSSVWLWNPEAANCTTTPYAELNEGWVYHDNGREPFEWVADMYNLRLALQAENDPSEKILKWAMASYYGRIAQRTGWDQRTRTPPAFHQIEWAGYITSFCRAMVYRAAFYAGVRGGLVSVDTDGIISTIPIPDKYLVNGRGNQLGRWKAEEYDGLIYLQNGVYWLRKDKKWEDPKLRGIPRSKMDPELALEALRSGGILHLDRHIFVGYGAALQRDRSEWRQWVDRPVKINAQQAGSRIHVPQICRTCQSGNMLLDMGLHDLSVLPERGGVSKPHRLPWLDPKSSHPDWIQDELFFSDPHETIDVT
jgi:hypothetical protein